MITIMVPALNEELSLRDTIQSIVRAAEINTVELYIIIVNDGSTDNTYDIICELEREFSFVRSIHNKKNLGVGKSLVEAIKIAKGDKFLILPGDGDVEENDISRLLSNKDKAEMVFLYFPNREIKGRFRSVLSKMYSTVYILFFDIYVQYIMGPCIYPTNKLRELTLKSNRFGIISEITTKILLLGSTFHEMPAYMRVGAKGSTALSVSNIIDVCLTFVRLLLETKIINRRVFNKKPSRIY